MTELYILPIFGIIITLVAFFSAVALRKKIKFVLFNPVLIASAIIILFLVLGDVSFTDYNKGGKYLSFFLGPAIVALGVLFFEKYQLIKHNIYPFLLAVCCGGAVSILSVSSIAFFLGMPPMSL